MPDGRWIPSPPPLAPPATYRQSLLASAETCMRRTWHSLHTPDDLAVGYVEAAGDLGTVVHAVFAEAVATMRANGETQIPTQEMVEVLREVYTKSPIMLPSDERDALVGLCLAFCAYKIETRRVIGIEERLEAQIVCPDGKTRTLTGQPDLLIADPPEGIVIVDYKSGRGKPKAPRKAPPEGETVRGKQYLSDRGHFQLDTYGLLVLVNRPQANHVTLRELHLRSGEIREATLSRMDLEHVEYELGVHMQKLEEAILAGGDDERWKPRPGRHCLRSCPVAQSCPVPQEQRGLGSLASDEDADAMAKRYVVIDALRGQMRDGAKAYYEETGHALEVGDGTVMRWKEGTDRKRSFGVFEPDEDQSTDRKAAI